MERTIDVASPATASNDRFAVQLRLISWGVLVATIPLVFYFTTLGTWSLTKQNTDGGWSATFYWRQAESMLMRGRLDVAPLDLQGECFKRDSRCYGYFGLTPSLVRMPFLGILRFFHSALTPLFLGIAILLALWAALQILQRSLHEHGPPTLPRAWTLGYFVLAALALGPGSTLLFLARSAVYEEAIAWGVAFFLLALNHVWAWQARDARSLVPAVVFGILAANARPTAAISCGVLGLLAVWWGWRQRAPTRAVAAALCLSMLPGLAAAGVFWLKLRSPIPSMFLNEQFQAAPHWQVILQKNGRRTAGLMFAPTALTAYFRPDTVVGRPEWPFFDFRFPQEPIRWVPPLPEGGAYVERTASVTATMPLPWVLTLMAAVWLCGQAWRLFGRRPEPALAQRLSQAREHWTFLAGSVASTAAMAVLTVTTVGITNRYLPDFFATSVVGVALGHRAILPLLSRRPLLGVTSGLIALLLVVWSVVVNLSLTTHLVFNSF